jgi:hypothetical protein
MWQSYSTCWSTPEGERSQTLARRVSSDVQYRDPNVEVAGIDALSKYMDGFQRQFPGHRFQIADVVEHHGRSCARWRHLDAAGQVRGEGVSFAQHDAEGRLRDITGFFR